MPTEYEKEWANFLMEQGVDVVIGTNPNVLQPYGYLTDDAGHNMLIYYSLGNFVTGQETLKQLRRHGYLYHPENCRRRPDHH